MNTLPGLLVYLEIDYLSGASQKQKSIIGVSAPYASQQSFKCNVTLPDQAAPYTIYGQDSLQAMTLSLAFLESRLIDMKSKGDRFYFPDSDDEVPLEAYFPSK